MCVSVAHVTHIMSTLTIPIRPVDTLWFLAELDGIPVNAHTHTHIPVVLYMLLLTLEGDIGPAKAWPTIGVSGLPTTVLSCCCVYPSEVQGLPNWGGVELSNSDATHAALQAQNGR